MKKILLIRFSSIGDIVLTTPVVRAIKSELNCELHVLTKKQNEELYLNNPKIDKVFSFRSSENEVISLLQKENYDFIVDLQKNLRSAKIRKALKKSWAAFPKLNIEKWIFVNFKINRLPDVHIVDRYFEAVKPLGVKNDNEGLDYFIPDKDKVVLETIDKGISDGYIAFVLGGQHYTKIFPPEKVSQVINKLDYPIVLLGGKEDWNRGEEVKKLTTGKKVINTCGSLNLNSSASLVKQCKVLVTNDTGLMHIGAAFKKPVVSIWGNTVPEFGMYPYMPGDEDKIYISEVKGLSCRPCSKIGYKKCPKRHFKCMKYQNVDEIVSVIKEFWERFN